MPQKYTPVVQEVWLKKLTSGQFTSLTSAKKSIGKMSWSKAHKDRAVTLSEKYFAAPTKFKETFFGNGEVAADAAPTAPEIPSMPEASSNVATAVARSVAAVADASRFATFDRLLDRSRTLAATIHDTVESYKTLRGSQAVRETESLIPALGKLQQVIDRLAEDLLDGIPSVLVGSASAPAAPAASVETDEATEEDEDEEEPPVRRPTWASQGTDESEGDAESVLSSSNDGA